MRDFKTLGQLTDIIANNLNSENEQLRNHAKTLLGPRKHGSTTRLPLSAVNKDTKVTYVNDPNGIIMPGCIGYYFEAPHLEGRLGALQLGAVHSLGLEEYVRETEGIHGLELTIDRKYLSSNQLELFTRENWITVIVGEFEGELAVFTWHPGRPMKPYNGERQAITAVKLVN